MNVHVRIALWLAGALALGACGKEGTVVIDVPATEGAEEQAGSTLEEIAIPSAEEAEREAARIIDASNADAEFEKLKQEIDADG